MSRIPQQYRLPLLIALGLHIVIIVALSIHLSATRYRLPAPSAKRTIVKAEAVDQAQVARQISKIKHEEHLKQEQARRLQRKALAAKRARIKEQRRLAKLKKARLKLKRQQRAQAKHLAALKKRRKAKEAALKKQRAVKSKRLALQQKQLQQKLLQQQLQSEQKNITQTTSAQWRGVVNRYKAQILAAIMPNWYIPSDAHKSQKVICLVQLAPGGEVVDVKLVRSSGNVALDRSARTAIYKSSPLPVPQDPELFNQFRELRLTLSPKTLING